MSWDFNKNPRVLLKAADLLRSVLLVSEAWFKNSQLVIWCPVLLVTHTMTGYTLINHTLKLWIVEETVCIHSVVCQLSVQRSRGTSVGSWPRARARWSLSDGGRVCRHVQGGNDGNRPDLTHSLWTVGTDPCTGVTFKTLLSFLQKVR